MINGFIIIDKPAGITSHDVVNRVRRILGTRKVGHTGTLDPFATGVLPVAINEGTKAIPFLDEGVKCYEAVIRLGLATDTQDMTGRVLREGDWSLVDEEYFKSVLSRFIGEIDQVPPMFSAIKRNGQPLYKLARQGMEVERHPRRVNIHSLELTSFEPPLVAVSVVCSRGTYVRSLADDIGYEVGCGGALHALRRTASGSFRVEDAMTLDALEEAALNRTVNDFRWSPYAALEHLADIPLDETAFHDTRCGRVPLLSYVFIGNEARLVRLSYNKKLIAVAEVSHTDGQPRMILKRVFL